MARPHPPDIIAELEQASAARREKAAEAEAITRINVLEARLARVEAALAAQDTSGFATWSALPKFLIEIFREYTDAKITPLLNRIAALEVISGTTSKPSNVRAIKSGKVA
jgi:hypothetical protein